MLNPKQQAFVREYITDFNATAAAIRAGYSEKTAKSHGNRLMTNVDIQAAIAEHTDQAKSSKIMEYAEACEILSAVARGNVGAYLNEDGGIDIERVKSHCPEAVQGIEQRAEVTDDGQVVMTTKFKLADRTRALERLAKLKGWDRPQKVQTQDTTPPRYDLSKLSDDELSSFEVLLSKAQPGD